MVDRSNNIFLVVWSNDRFLCHVVNYSAFFLSSNQLHVKESSPLRRWLFMLNLVTIMTPSSSNQYIPSCIFLLISQYTVFFSKLSVEKSLFSQTSRKIPVTDIYDTNRVKIILCNLSQNSYRCLVCEQVIRAL